MKIIDLIRSDAARYDAKASLLWLYFWKQGFRLSFWLRLAKASRTWPSVAWPLKIIVWYGLRRTQYLFGTDIGADTTIGPGLFIPHAIGIVVHSKAKIGSNMCLSHNVTIGKKHSGRMAGYPTVGNDVYIAPGAVVIGGIKIGDRAVVGPNSVVVRDVGQDTTVSGGAALPLNVVRETPRVSNDA